MFELPKRDLNGAFTSLPLDDVHFGAGSLEKLGPTLEMHGVERALIITGNTLANKTDLVDKVKAATGGRTAAVFSESIQHVPRQGSCAPPRWPVSTISTGSSVLAAAARTIRQRR